MAEVFDLASAFLRAEQLKGAEQNRRLQQQAFQQKQLQDQAAQERDALFNQTATEYQPGGDNSSLYAKMAQIDPERTILVRKAIEGGLGGASARGFDPKIAINKDGKRILIQPVFDPSTGQSTVNRAELPEGFELESLNPIEKSNLDIKTTIGKELGKDSAARANIAITTGVDAAKGIPVLKRTLSLLDSVKTGGFSNAALRAKQLLGIEGADEGELSANMGQAILGDLRSTFGAAFTEKEGARLERIRANFGKNAEANKRLIKQSLQIAEDTANRAMKSAADNGDFRTAQEIQDLMSFEFDMNDQKTEQKKVIKFDAQGNMIQ